MIISMKNISKSYDKTDVIKNLDLTIKDKEFTTLLGPSGCGKTTILRMIAGLETPSAGEIYFDDICVYSQEKKINLPPERRNIGFVFQDFALWPHLTVFENVAFGLRARKDRKNLEKRVMDALEAVHLAEFRNRYPAQLSGGQQQRVGFARAIVTRPDCILFDEPLSALDAILRDEMRIEIKRLTSELAVTAVFVTHDQMEAMSMSDRIVVLNKGTIEQEGEPEEIYQRPKTCFTAKFIGKSNWLSDNAMFRPETASLEKKEGYKEYETVLEGIQFLGENYQLYLNASGRKWGIEAPCRYNVGSRVSVYINEDKIVTF
ncbi:iron(III) transport system ATP-binding protein [Catenibacillus scindens]|uniref:ABC-type quaternary amine transporter n=1 Tax=Catenibacillus scindens TaxID=673271 RepID=A0A7W8HDM5_9FIRM|nr:ABC transporter ATP-binding protein [Catenibacillus scindens]MBB5266385.1 iron(III) transport system ATP-binding protein [Catenibacillus scindens]